jgi:hypothetical protein
MIDHQHRASTEDLKRSTALIPMSELLEDPVYRKFLLTPPDMPEHARNKEFNLSPLWVVYVQRVPGGKWGKKEFWSYKKAFKFFKKCLKQYKVHDLAINNKRVGCVPPSRFVRIRGKYVTGSDGKRRQATTRVYWKVKVHPEDEEHHWCKYCRRPTVFKYYTSHKRLGVVDPGVRRCCICGASERIAIHTPSDKSFRVH